jgi:ubiquitin C-terminal hydrolase
LIHVSDDAHEFIRVLVDKLCEVMKDDTRCQNNNVGVIATDEELECMSTLLKSDYRLKEHLSSNSSIITDEFCGQLISTIQCTDCNKKYTKDPFYDLSLPFPERSTDLQQHCTLDDCIREFSKEELLDGDNMIECKNCRCKRVGIKRLQVSDFPNVLVLHLKRSVFTQRMNGNGRACDVVEGKVQTRVKFPTTDFNASSMAYESDTLQSQPIYNLFAVCNMRGTQPAGGITQRHVSILTPTHGIPLMTNTCKS